jgi:nucleoside-diphosphate-sugar epimerase
MKKIAVTGSSGVVGRALCADMSKDHEVVEIDVLDAPVTIDVRDLDALERAFVGCEAVVHLAGYSSVLSTWDEVHGANIGGTFNVYEAARRAGVRHVIFASSNHAVGMHEVLGGSDLYKAGAGVTVGTDEPFRADSLYGVSKAFGEVLGRYYSETYGIRVACVRIGSVLEGDSPTAPELGIPAFLPNLTAKDVHPRYAATWMSKRDFAGLVRAILASDVAYGVVYGVGDNLTRFWDLEPGRALYGFWPQDGTRTMRS